MKIHRELDADLFARLVEYAAGNLPADEARAVASHLDACAVCREAVAGMRPTLESLLLSPAPATPPASAWNRIAERIARAGDDVQPWKAWKVAEPTPDFLVRAAASGGWRPTAIDGIEVRELSVEPDGSAVTMLIRMSPGTSFPAHEHGGPEECFVLEGDLVIGDVEMRGGDFQRMEPGTVHPEQTTRGGCLLFLRSSTNDRLLG